MIFTFCDEATLRDDFPRYLSKLGPQQSGAKLALVIAVCIFSVAILLYSLPAGS